jgi:phospholipid N-methyltransferase
MSDYQARVNVEFTDVENEKECSAILKRLFSDAHIIDWDILEIEALSGDAPEPEEEEP